MRTVSADASAVVEVIRTEQHAFWMKDPESFAQCHLHDSASIRWGYWQGGGIILQRGWQEIGPRSLEHMERLPRPIPEFANAPMTNLNLHVSSKMAWASFDREYPYLPGISGQGPNGTTQNIRILEKHDGYWLIVMSGLLDAHLGDEVAIRVAATGKVLWTSTKAAARLGHDERFVVRAGRLCMRDRRLDARLQAAVDWAAALDRHLMPQRGALPILLGSDIGVPRTAWVIADSGAALVLLDDQRPISARVDIAAQALALSPVQARLTLALCEGKHVSDFAQEANITLNTARTQLKRTFEKAGVSSQAALLRAVLTMTPPR